MTGGRGVQDELPNVYVHSHALTHGLTEDEVLEAWGNFAARQARSAPDEGETVAVGFTRSGKEVQMIGIARTFGMLIIHAMSPATEKVLRELRLKR